MEKVACQYAIVRFMPFLETGEFANVGILMIAPRARYFGFELMKRKHRRVTQFFDELDAKVLRGTMHDLGEELDRVHQLLKFHGFDKRLKNNDENFAKDLFAEVLRARETILRFSDPGIVLTTDPKRELKNLYSRYVERNFVTKEYREHVLEGRLKKLFVRENLIDRFKQEKIGSDRYRVTFPFVEMRENRPLRIIKPLNIAQGDPSAIIERGGRWGFRVNELRKRNLLPEHVLFTVDDHADEVDLEDAYTEALDILRETGVNVLPQGKEQEILQFAAESEQTRRW